jgi:hypothetical protein
MSLALCSLRRDCKAADLAILKTTETARNVLVPDQRDIKNFSESRNHAALGAVRSVQLAVTVSRYRSCAPFKNDFAETFVLVD